LNVDPYNNYPETKKGGPPPRPGQVHGTFGTRVAQAPQPPVSGGGGSGSGGISLQQENAMLYSDLRTAVDYIKQLGGTWPPPGH